MTEPVEFTVSSAYTRQDVDTEVRAVKTSIERSPIHVHGGRLRFFYPDDMSPVPAPEGLVFLIERPGTYYLDESNTLRLLDGLGEESR